MEIGYRNYVKFSDRIWKGKTLYIIKLMDYVWFSEIPFFPHTKTHRDESMNYWFYFQGIYWNKVCWKMVGVDYY